MPKTWIYFLALVLPLVAHVLVLDTRYFLEWLWYNGHADLYHTLSAASVHPWVEKLLAGWPLPVFIVTVLFYWFADIQDSDYSTAQFLLLPIVYVPFFVIGRLLETWEFDMKLVTLYPLVIVIFGYCYVLPWVLLVWLGSKMRLVV